MGVWILLALAMSAVVAYPRQNQDVVVADQVSPVDSGLDNLRRLKMKPVAQALKPLTFSGRASAAVKGIFGGKKENPKVQKLKRQDLGGMYEQRGNIFQEDTSKNRIAVRSGGFSKNMDIHDYDRVRRGEESRRTYFYR
ncbi:hypothetical protein AeRB84_017616 [Aphanomyces euteiches]|nr:hypothetical protein AeRB84_017616 [Aphanomyces euteiches]